LSLCSESVLTHCTAHYRELFSVSASLNETSADTLNCSSLSRADFSFFLRVFGAKREKGSLSTLFVKGFYRPKKKTKNKWATLTLEKGVFALLGAEISIRWYLCAAPDALRL
ncbi:MAG: hypothetical protein V3V63_04525, partial [Candidatus Hydrothermarchaeaceae archaeon]